MTHAHSPSSIAVSPRRSRRAAVAMRVCALLLAAAMLSPLASSPASARQATGLPGNVLQASVRIMTNVEVTPDDRDEDPFLCMLDDDIVLDISVGSGTIVTEDGYILTNHHVMDAGRMPREVSDFCEDQAPRGRGEAEWTHTVCCLLYTSPSPRDGLLSRMPSSA